MRASGGRKRPFPDALAKQADLNGEQSKKGRGGVKEPNCPLLLGGFVGGDFAVADIDDAMSVLGDVVFVGDENDGVALAV